MLIGYMEKPKEDKPKQRIKTIDVIDENIYNELQLKASKRGLSLRQYVNVIFEWKVKRDKLIQKLYPNLTKLATDGNFVVIEDSDTNEIIKVHSRNNKLACSKHKKQCCEHTEFTMSTLDYPDLFDSGR